MSFFFAFADEIGVDGAKLAQFNAIIGDAGQQCPVLIKIEQEEWPEPSKEKISKRKQRKERAARTPKPLPDHVVERLEKKKNLFLIKQQRIVRKIARVQERDVGPALFFDFQSTLVPNRFNLLVKIFNFAKGEYVTLQEVPLVGTRFMIAEAAKKKICEFSCTYFHKYFKKMQIGALRRFFQHRGEFTRRTFHCDFSSLRNFYFFNGFQDLWQDLETKMRFNLTTICREVEDRLCIYLTRVGILRYSLKKQENSYFHSLRFFLKKKIENEVRRLLQEEQKKKIFSKIQNSFVDAERLRRAARNERVRGALAECEMQKKKNLIEYQKKLFKIEFNEPIFYYIPCSKEWRAKLAAKLKALLCAFKEERLEGASPLKNWEKKKKIFSYDFKDKTKIQVLPPGCVVHQMDSETNVDPVVSPTIDRSSNVVTIDQGAVSKVEVQTPVSYLTQSAEGSQRSIMSELVERWVPFDQFKWSESDTVGTKIKGYSLPKDLFVNLSEDAPNFIALKKFSYWAFDMHFRVQINANRYQVGQLIVAWNYSTGGRVLENVAQAIQAPHHKINAPGNNVLELVIPYKFCFPYWHISNVLESLPLVQMSIFVNSALSLPDATMNSCNVFIQVKLENAKLAGMRRNNDYPNHQMMRMLLKGAESVLRYVNSDANRDNPTDVSSATHVVPYSAHSWCIGDNATQVANVLRLDAIATTPHFDGEDEMKISFVVSHFGGLVNKKWSTNDAFKKQILKFPVAPFHTRDVRTKYSGVSRQLGEYCLTPVGRIASMFAYWRGSLEFRFDFIASMFHTGRVAVIFVPIKSSDDYEKDSQSYVEYFDLQDNTSFTFICPYISNVPWYPAQDPSTRFPAREPPKIGDIVMYVANPLIAITGVSDDVTIITYVRGGKDFEVAVPVFPSSFPSLIGTSYHPSPSTISPKRGYYPVYSGSWHLFPNKVFLRYGTVSDHVVQWDSGDFKAIYYADDPALIWDYDSKGRKQLSQYRYFARAKISGQEAYIYMIPFKNYDEAKLYADNPQIDFATDFVDSTDYFWKLGTALEPIVVAHQGVGDATISTLATTPGISSSCSAMQFFNESFIDLKSLLRRYFLYCDVSVLISKENPYGGVFYVVPIIPAGLQFNYKTIPKNNKSVEFQSRIRGGPIANVADGYRFFRGGMRAKIIFRNKNGKDIFLQVTHVPDQLPYVEPTPVTPKSTLDFIGNGYAYYSQSSRINECIEIEIPYYLNCDYGLLAHPKEVMGNYKDRCSLGYLAFSTLSRLEEDYDLTMQVFLSFADDMRFSSFQGFRNASTAFGLPLEDTKDETLELSKSRSRVNSDGFEELRLESVRISHQMERIKEKFKQGFDYIGDSFSERFRAAGEDVGEGWASRLSATASQISGDVMEKIREVLNLIENTASKYFSIGKSFFFTIVTQLAHLLVNPNFMTMIICIATIWASFLPNDTNYELFNTFVNYLKRPEVLIMLGWVAGVNGGCFVAEKHIRASHQFDPVTWVDFTAAVVTAIATFLGYKVKRDQLASCPNFMKYLITHIKEISLTAAGVVSFLKLNVKVFGNIIDWVMQRFAGVGIDAFCLTDNARLKAWIKVAQSLTNPLNKQYIFLEETYQQQVHAMVSVGQEYVAAGCSRAESTVLMQYIRELLGKLIKLQDELIDNCYCSNARFVPFVVQLTGPPGIGKSELYTELGITLLESVNYICAGDPVFIKCSGPAYWNGVRNQPILLYDDFLFMKGEAAAAQIMEFQQIKSPATFNPNIAELEMKKLKYNPMIVCLASNAAYWNNLPEVRDHVALHRRRDVLYECRLKEGVSMEEVRAGFVERGYKTYDHLEFRQNLNVIEDDGQKGPWMSYASFRDDLIAKWKSYYTSELGMYRNRLKDSLRLKFQDKMDIEVEPLDIIFKTNLMDKVDKLPREAERKSFASWVRERVDNSTMTVLGKPEELRRVEDMVNGLHPKLTRLGQIRTPVAEEVEKKNFTAIERLRAEKILKAVDEVGEDMKYYFDLEAFSQQPTDRDECIRLTREYIAKERAKHEMAWGDPEPGCSSKPDALDFLPVDSESDDDQEYGSAESQQLISGDLPSSAFLKSRRKQRYPSEDKKDKHLFKLLIDYPQYRFCCVHEAFFNDSWFYTKDHERGYCYVNFNKMAMMPEICAGDCFFKRPEYELIRHEWFKNKYELDARIGVLPDVSMVPQWAHKWLPADHLLKGMAPTAVTVMIDQGATRAESFLKRIGKLAWWRWTKKILKWAGILSTAFLAIFGTYAGVTKLLDYVKGDSVDPTEAPVMTTTADPWHEYAPSGDIRTGRQPSRFRQKLVAQGRNIQKKFNLHQYDEKTPLYNLEALLMRNSFEVCLEINGIRKFRQKGLGICARKAFTTKHFYEEFANQREKEGDKNVSLVYEKDGLHLSFPFSQLKFYLEDSSSLGIIEFPVTLNCFRDIRKHIVSEAELGYLGRHGKFYCYQEGKHLFHDIAFDECEDLEIAGTESVSDQVLPAVYKYRISGPGKCGSVLYTRSNIPRIIGIHVAGIDGGIFGFAQPVIQETFADLSGISSTEPKGVHEFEEIPSLISPPQGVELIGTVSKEDAVAIPTKTQIVPSLMYDQISPHVTEPAVLKKNDPRCLVDPEIDPVVKAIQTHGLRPDAFDIEVLERCVDDMSDYIISTTPRNYLLLDDVLPDQIVFGGLPGGNIKKINLNASEGFPLSKIRTRREEPYFYFQEKKKTLGLPLKGKHWLFDFVETQDGLELVEIHPILKDLINSNMSLRINGVLPDTVFVDVLKDARVPFDKIQKGKTRMFSMSPIEFTWACKKYFGAFQSAYQAGRIINGTAIGINVNSGEWTELGRQLLIRGQKIVVGDYKSFGDTLARDVMWGAFEVILNWYSYNYERPPSNKIREVLREELFNVPHLVYNLLYRMVCGIPSGFALTVEINDLVNQLYMRYCWVKITGRPLSDFYRFCKLVTYGDDLIMSVNECVIDEFNFVSIRDELAKVNILFQPATKDDNIVPFQNFFEVTFLKCNFVKHHKRLNFFVARLPLASCLDMLNWQYKDNDKVTIIFENCRASLMNLYGWGPKVYHHWRKLMIEWISRAVESGELPADCLPCHFKSWTEVDNEIFQDSN
ncbi:TPA_asm: polyprotein [Iflavirus HdromIV]|nr:TPA_asm: polyprotein [Iflavirus HdromIV]